MMIEKRYSRVADPTVFLIYSSDHVAEMFFEETCALLYKFNAVTMCARYKVNFAHIPHIKY